MFDPGAALAVAVPEAAPLFVGAVLLGLVHGAEPGHGWPIAAAYAMDRTNRWVAGVVAATVIGVGHLVSSLAVVGVFFAAKSYFALTRVNEPIRLLPGVTIGGPVSVVAGLLLIGLGVREYRRGGHSHGGGDPGDGHHGSDHNDGHDHGHGDGHAPSHGDGGHARDHDHGAALDADRGLRGLASAAFVLGFGHEEEFEIIALCTGSERCLELMLAYALAVVVALVALTLLLVAGYARYEERVEELAAWFPAVSAAVLVVMGIGFVLGLF